MNTTWSYFQFITIVLLAKCGFVTGFVSGDLHIAVSLWEYIGEEACAKLVKEKEPNATGASYRPGDGFCWAGFGNTTTDCSVCLACVFEGIFILITPVQIDYKYRA